ncbi:MAG: DUF4432 family protein [Actinomycetota bacterium]
MDSPFGERVLDGAREQGMKVAVVRTREDFRFAVAPRRGMDVPSAEVLRGEVWENLFWESGTGVVDPALCDVNGRAWLRGFFGGMLTCGPENVGPPAEGFPSHGSLSMTPAGEVVSRTEGERLVVEGKMAVRYALTGPHFEVRRRVVGLSGRTAIRFEDRVTNVGSHPAELMWKYHPCFAVCGPGAILAPVVRARARDVLADLGLEDWRRVAAPADACEFEQVFDLEVEPGQDGFVTVAGLPDDQERPAVYVRYRPDNLSRLTLWKHPREGVIGIEPGNCDVMGISTERERGTLEVLAAGASRDFEVEIGFVVGSRGIEGLPKEGAATRTVGLVGSDGTPRQGSPAREAT